MLCLFFFITLDVNAPDSKLKWMNVFKRKISNTVVLAFQFTSIFCLFQSRFHIWIPPPQGPLHWGRHREDQLPGFFPSSLGFRKWSINNSDFLLLIVFKIAHYFRSWITSPMMRRSVFWKRWHCFLRRSFWSLALLVVVFFHHSYFTFFKAILLFTHFSISMGAR